MALHLQSLITVTETAKAVRHEVRDSVVFAVRMIMQGDGGLMAYIRNNTEELTGYQEHAPLTPSIDLACDFVMVYGTDRTMPERVRKFREAGYVVHLMTGIAWGEYQDYLNGETDGREHWDEGQRDRDGTPINHGPSVPYMVPTVAFSNYLTERLKAAVDAGVEAIHLEEPEFWDWGGYSEAFRREYEIRYREPFVPQHESVDAHYRTAQLKAELYARALSRCSQAVKEYAKVQYGKDLRFYVPTHSLINYTQWKIMSPEAALIGLDTVDGYIAQIWTGTSREANVYEGFYRERTFETAFLEYGVMQELTRGTGRRMWFLNDPIEDARGYTWENYRYNYHKTAVASLLNPEVWHYEICPWPQRVFDGVYPRLEPQAAGQEEPSMEHPEPRPIPDSYRTFLCSMFQLFGDMDQLVYAFEGMPETAGVFMSDTGLFERTFPDPVPTAPGYWAAMGAVKTKNSDVPAGAEAERRIAASRKFMEDTEGDAAKENSFITSTAFPQFFGLAMPLLKYGLPLRPVQLDNIRRFPGYLKDIRCAILSYEFMKPVSPDINLSIAEWVRSGGMLIYAGNESDPFHEIRSWWREAGYRTPAEHLFEILGLGRTPADGRYDFGNGTVTVYRILPARICLKKEYADAWRSLVRDTLEAGGLHWVYRNDITLKRGPYLICAVMDESVNDEPKVLRGCFADLMADGYPIITEKTVRPDEGAILFDLDTLKPGEFRVIAAAARITEPVAGERELSFRARTADRGLTTIRMRLPYPVGKALAADEDGTPVDVSCEYDAATQTALFVYRSCGRTVHIRAERTE